MWNPSEVDVEDLAPAARELAAGRLDEAIPLLVGVFATCLGGPITGAVAAGSAELIRRWLKNTADKRLAEEIAKIDDFEERANFVAHYLLDKIRTTSVEDIRNIRTEIEDFRTHNDELFVQQMRVEQQQNEKLDQLGARFDKFEDLLRNLPDKEGQRLAISTTDDAGDLRQEGFDLRDRLKRRFKVYDISEAFRIADEFGAWLSTHERQIPPDDACEHYLQLVSGELIRHATTQGEQPRAKALTRAREHLQAARQFDREGNNMCRVNSLLAAIDSRDGHTDLALQKLEQLDCPEAVFWRLVILHDQGRFEEAAAIAQQRSPDPKWCESAVGAAVRSRNFKQARDLIGWVTDLEDTTRQDRTVLSFAWELLNLAHERAPGYVPSADVLDAELSTEFRYALSLLEGPLRTILARRKTREEIEAHQLAIAAAINHWLGQTDDAVMLLDLLVSHVPIPLAVARGVIQGLPLKVQDLADRTRKEHPESFEAALLAAAVREVDGDYETALSEAIELVPRAGSDESRKSLAETLANLSQHAPADRRKDIDALIASLVGDDSKLIAYRKVERLIERGKMREAESELTECEDPTNSHWLQLKAKYHLAADEPDRAAVALRAAASIFPHPEILRAAASLALRQGLIEEAVSCLEAIVRVAPSEHDRHNLAVGYLKLGRPSDAAQEFSLLAKRAPDPYFLYQAKAFAHVQEFDRAIEAIQKHIDSLREPRMEDFYLYVNIRRLQDEPDAALDFLQIYRSQFWDNPDFLRLFVSTAYAAQKEHFAGEALNHLLILRSRGDIGPDVIKEASLDDMLKIHRSEIEYYRALADKYLVGEMPWLLLDEVMRRTPYWGWYLRTQELPWITNSPENRATFSVYATDGPDRFEEPINLRVGDRRILADTSALITLDRLGKLERLVDYVGRIEIPSTALLAYLDEVQALLPHQPSRETANEAIQRAFDTERIHIPEEDAEIVFVDEYPSNAASAGFGLRDIADVLYAAGEMDQLVRDKTNAVATLPKSRDVSQLTVHARVRFTLSTLQTVYQLGALEAVLRGFEVYITKAELGELARDAHAYQVRDLVRQRHLDLWGKIIEDKRFVGVDRVTTEAKGDAAASRALSALQIGRSRRSLLIADDRCLQRIARSDSSERCICLSSDAILEALWLDGCLPIEELADAYVRMMRWRYRFLVPPPEVLVALSSGYRPPGRPLKDLAMYVHDCMNDPGIARYQTDQGIPGSGAERLALKWSRCLGQFISLIWLAEENSEKDAEALTQWTATSALPQAPPILGVRTTHLERILPTHCLSSAITVATTAFSPARLGRGLDVLASALHIDDADYARIVAGIVYAVA